MEQTVDNLKHQNDIPQEHISERIVDQAVDAPFPQDVASAPAVARRRRTGKSAESLPAVACATPDTVSEYVAPVIEFVSPAAVCAAPTPVIDSEDPAIDCAPPAAAYAAPTRVIESVAPVNEYASRTAAYAAPAPVIDSVAPVFESMSSCTAHTPVIDSGASAPAFTSKSESEFSALRAEAEAELLELATAYAELEAQSADLAAQSLLEEERQAAQTTKKPKEAQQAAQAKKKPKPRHKKR